MIAQPAANRHAGETAQSMLPGVDATHKTVASALIKSPLRYPGGKSRAVKQILALLPPDIERLCSPFVGGGSVELALASRGVQVYAYDVFEPLVNFWRVLLDDAHGLSEKVRGYYPLSREDFYALQKRHTTIADQREMATVFFVLNRCSFSGTTLSGGMSPQHPRFTKTCIDKLAQFKANGLHIAHADFKRTFQKHQNDMMYLDPPYCIASQLYGKGGDCHKNFDHQGLAELLRRRDGWLLSYNDCEMIRELYRGHRFLSPQWTYGMSKSKASNEVFILSHDFPHAPCAAPPPLFPAHMQMRMPFAFGALE